MFSFSTHIYRPLLCNLKPVTFNCAAVLRGIRRKQTVCNSSPIPLLMTEYASSSSLTVDQTPVSCCFSMIYTNGNWVPSFPLYTLQTRGTYLLHQANTTGISTSSQAHRALRENIRIIREIYLVSSWSLWWKKHSKRQQLRPFLLTSC